MRLGRHPTHPLLRLGGFCGALGCAVGLLAIAFAGSRPFNALRCAVEGRDGWMIELPADLRTASDVRRAVQAQTRCVPVEIGYVDFGIVADGHLAVPVDAPRKWVEPGAAIKVWVEGTRGDATDECAPLGPSAAPPDGCPGGPQPAAPARP